MNKDAIALATDSASTSIYKSENEDNVVKIFNFNKLFMLSREKPIAIMIYNYSEYLSIPWETIIKIYRDQTLKKEGFNYVKEYYDDFFNFLLKSDIFDEDKKNFNFKRYVYKICGEMKKILDFSRFINEMKESEDPTNMTFPELHQKYEEYRRTTIKKMADSVENFDYYDDFSDIDYKEIRSSKDVVLKEIIEDEFPDDIVQYENFKNIIIKSLIKKQDLIKVPYSGIVISGFGEKDIYPSTYSCEISLELNNKLIRSNVEENHIDHKYTSAILPYGQSDVIDTFITGINPQYEYFLEKLITDLWEELFKSIKEEIKNYKNCKSTMTNLLKKIKIIPVAEIKNIMRELISDNSDTLLDTIDILPKEDLAVLAESLVNLTSLKRKYSNEHETVRGPVDVAVISKGDGFIWIKRKHYFKKDFNPDYFRKINSI